MVNRQIAQPGVAWACQTCWKLFTAASSIERQDKQHRNADGQPCPGHGEQASKVLVDHQGQPLPGQLPSGVLCRRPASKSVWANATPASAQSAYLTTVISPASTPVAAPPARVQIGSAAAETTARRSLVVVLKHGRSSPFSTTPDESINSGGATARSSLVVVFKYKRSETPTTMPDEPTTPGTSSLMPPVRKSLIVSLRYRPPVPYIPPPPPSPATVAAYYPYPVPRTSTWSTDTAFGPPLQPGESDLPQFSLDHWRSCWN